MNQPLVWGIGYIVPQCIDTPNFICAIKQEGLGGTLEVYDSLSNGLGSTNDPSLKSKNLLPGWLDIFLSQCTLCTDMQ